MSSKDKSIDEPILRLVDAVKAYIVDQLRVFTKQEHGSGKFVESPEYPEFPWFEGIINAVAHRDYAASGQFIKVSMFDDRLEIESPGRFSKYCDSGQYFIHKILTEQDDCQSYDRI